MERTLIKDIQAGKQVKIAGFVENLRNKSAMQFIVLRDISGKVQITVEKAKLPEIAKIIDGVTVESVLTVTGLAVKNDYVKLGGLEIIPDRVTVDSVAEVLPIDKESGLDLRLDYRWLDLRDPQKAKTFQVQTALERYMVDWLTDHGFIKIHTPKITAISSEGGSEVFELKNYFGSHAYLTQSPQLYKQMSMMAGFDRTFEIGECYRAESSFTSRHATEFTALDVEISHIENHHDVMDMEEALLTDVMNKLHAQFGDLIPAVTAKFPRLTLQEVYRILREEKHYEMPKAALGDIDPDGERLIGEYAKEKYHSDFVFITDYPHDARAFYTMDDRSFDLIYKGVEITSGAQREHRYEQLKQNVIAKGINPEHMKEYLDFFRYGAPTHGGFAIGLARLMARMLDLPTVKESCFVFRGPTRLKP
ncbi:MAG: aspartate--tRNA(Asn) ligase [Eubacteriales bacterium]|nr:aspartate--tRNA(Asn) ligase [Eubacteriales bacterium]